jgi:hypothetical protein
MGEYTAVDGLEIGSADVRNGKNPNSLQNFVCTAAMVRTKFYNLMKTSIFYRLT